MTSEIKRDRRARSVLILVLLLAVSGTSAAARLDAQQRVRLRIQPPLGDTLRMQLQQQFDVVNESAAGSAPGALMAGSINVWTHAIVLRRVGSGTDLLSVTDSVRISPPSAGSLAALRQAKRALEGRKVHLRVGPDGALTVAGASRDGTVVGVGTEMPSVLPAASVAVGETWTRDMRVPLSTRSGITALVRTTFRLDSLGQDGAIAYLSFRGKVSHNHAHDPHGGHGQTAGTIAGTMQVDRRLSWITNSQMLVTLASDYKPAGRPPIHARMRITQSLRALPGS